MGGAIDWLIAYGAGPLLGALVVGSVPFIRRRLGALFVGLFRVIRSPERLDKLEEWRTQHEERHVA